jgi:hypothetical protein
MSGQGQNMNVEYNSRYPQRVRKQTEEGMKSQAYIQKQRNAAAAAAQKAKETRELTKQVGNLSGIFSGLSFGSKGGYRRNRTAKRIIRKRKTIRRK